jgi:8-oxo-dGTP pyrophosphatase MutT (NUDIX family)
MSASLDALVARLSSTRSEIIARAEDASGAHAAVAAIVRDNDGRAEILFIKRAERKEDPWSGHMAFPGGRREETDASLLATAIRETREEVGIDLERSARAIARLPDVAPYSRMPHSLTVTAFVFALDQNENATPFAPNDEVARIVWAPLDAVLANERATTFRFQRDGADFLLPALDVGAGDQTDIVWGLTFRILELLREAVA